MRSSSPSALKIAAIVLSAAAVSWWFLRASHRSADDPLDGSRGGSEPDRGALAVVERKGTMRTTSTADYLDPPRRDSVMDQRELPQPALPPPDGLKRAELLSPLDARSPEDAAWLSRNGYPTRDEFDSLETTSAEELAARASTGDLAAQALLGSKQIQTRELRKGYANLEDAAVRGSIFAMIELARAQRAAGNTIESLAWFRLASLRGDHRAGELLGTAVDWPHLTTWNVMQAEAYAARYYHNLLQRRSEQRLGVFDNRLRPGFGTSLPAPGSMVGIYDRPPGG